VLSRFWINASKLAICILACQAAGALGTLTTATGDSVWYQSLEKPWFTPPGWVFAPAWITLYTLMGVAAYLVWRRGLSHPGVKLALGLFAVQLVLNAIWTPVFFGLQWPIGGLTVLIALLAVVLATLIAFRPISRTAMILMVPYLLWGAFALVLNGAIVRLNS
jgi:tryptophan-rich sensory protein